MIAASLLTIKVVEFKARYFYQFLLMAFLSFCFRGFVIIKQDGRNFCLTSVAKLNSHTIMHMHPFRASAPFPVTKDCLTFTIALEVRNISHLLARGNEYISFELDWVLVYDLL